MTTDHRFIIPILLALLTVAAACGDDDGAATPDDGDGGASPDGAPADTEAPRLVETSPADGSEGVSRTASFEAVFSEAMAEGSGTVRVRVEGEDVSVAPSLVEGDRLVIEPPGGAWPDASEVEVRLGDDFEDLAGNRIDRAHAVRFTTADDVAPTVVSSDPAEGATDVPARISAIRIRFSELMDHGAGTVALEGGPGEIDTDAPAWSPLEVSYAVSGLENDTAYRIVLSGFRDRTGNELDGTVTIEDGAIDFTTRPDDEPPQVVASTPVEAQVDVLVESLGGTIEVTFDEAMDTSATTAPLEVDGASTDVAITWSDDRTASFAIAGVAQQEADHALDLRALTDLAGNPIAVEPYLGDGILDFTTGVDAFVPYVAASSPAEGATDVPIPLGEVVIAFSEAMDVTLTDVVVTDDLSRTSTVTGAWRGGGTLLALPGSAFVPGRAASVDFSMLRDLSGTSVSTVHPYLGDGLLDFSIARPTGASCATPLLLEHADTVSMGRYDFEITREQRDRNNGSASCDPDGPSETDAVILYRKTTPALGDPSGAGRALRIRTFSVTNRANIEVLTGVCDPRDPGAAAARAVCVTGHASWDQLLDLPAGDHYIWVSTADGSPFDIDLALEEVAAIDEGEACSDPYDASSTVYVPPAASGDPHVFDLPTGPNNSVDVTASNGPFAAISCREEPFGDVVVEYTKAAADSVLDVRVRGSVTAEVITGACRASDPAASSAACMSFAGTGSSRMTAAGPAGPTYIWLAGTSSSAAAFPGARVEIRELPAPTEAGSSCATAIPITPGTSVPVTPAFAERYFAPSCIPTDSNVTWYAFDTTATLTHVTTTGAGAVGLVVAATGEQAGCATNATSSPVAALAPVGSRICVAVESGSAVSALAIEAIAYDGVGVTAPVQLDIEPPSLAGTPYTSILGDTWLALTPTTIWQNIGTAGIFSAPRAGTATAVARFDVDGAVLGDESIAVGEALFSMEFNENGPRLFRLTDATGAWSPMVWDPGASYARQTRNVTFDGTDFYTAEQLTSSSTTPRLSAIYRVPGGAPGAPVVAGEVDTVYNVESLAVDGTWFYLSAAESSSVRGVYRVRRSDVAAGVGSPVRIAAFGTSATLRLDDLASPGYLYVRQAGDIHVIEDPGGASPRYLGVIFDGVSGDRAMDVDRSSGSLVFFSTHDEPNGEWYRFDP